MTVNLYWLAALDWFWPLLGSIAVFLIARTVWRIIHGG